MMKSLKRLVALVLIPCMVFAGLPMAAQAGIVSTESAIAAPQAQANREHVTAFLDRDDVRSALQAQGVSADDALARVQAMSDVEVAQLAKRVDQAPAGGDILGVVFMVFLILLVTDILGLTKVFPFTRSVR